MPYLYKFKTTTHAGGLIILGMSFFLIMVFQHALLNAPRDAFFGMNIVLLLGVA